MSLKQPYRMIAIDLDGTLLSPTGVVTERTKSAVHRCLSAGLLVCFATGRNWTESKTVLDAVAHYDTAVFVGGAMVIDTKHRVTVHRTMMQPQLAADVCRFFETRGHAALAMQDTQSAGVDYVITSGLPVTTETATWMRVCKATVHHARSLADYPHEHTIRVSIVAPSRVTGELIRELQQQFGDRIVYHSIALLALGLDVLEVFDPAVNKWEGLRHVARRHGIQESEIIAIGDDVNDLPMIRNAGLGVAMGNARADVQSAAKRVIGRNDEDGLAKFLEELISEQEVQPLGEDAAA
ncbi:MAG TPA: HAD family hydrolase [Tepidisphaeraceae bacterium]|nr:HAD family hydrolase [Tepidisphaeraceae bacterium]